MLWKPLLSATIPIDPATGDFDWNCIPLPVYASYKYDGYRAMVQDGILVSRNGLPVRNRELQARYGKPEYEGMDGEMVDGPPNAPSAFNRTSRVVNNAAASAVDTKMYVIDWFLEEDITELRHRIRGTEEYFEKPSKHLVVAKQKICKTVAQVQDFERKAVAAGWEGVMLRRADQGPYPQKPGKQNRSTLREFYLARLKRFEYDFAKIVRPHPLEHNLNEERTAAGKRSTKKAGIAVDHARAGSVTVLGTTGLAKGLEFNITVPTNALRAKGAEWWGRQIGREIRYKYQVVGTKDKPRILTATFEELGL